LNDEFIGKVVVVTGAGTGLGRWIAEGFAKAGAHTIITGINLDECMDVAGGLQECQGKVIARQMDVTNLSEIKDTLQFVIDEFSRVDVLVNNAGLVWKRKALEVDEEFFDQMNAVNVKGAFFVAQTFGAQMVQQQSGKIINITSAAGKLIRKGLANPIYNMNKGAINMMTKALAEEFSQYHVNVNAIGPGYFETGPVKERFVNPAVYETVIESTPLGKIGQADDIQGTALFLGSKLSDFITGQIIYVDGGRTIL